MKKFFSLIIALLTVLTLLPAPALADDAGNLTPIDIGGGASESVSTAVHVRYGGYDIKNIKLLVGGEPITLDLSGDNNERVFLSSSVTSVGSTAPFTAAVSGSSLTVTPGSASGEGSILLCTLSNPAGVTVNITVDSPSEDASGLTPLFYVEGTAGNLTARYCYRRTGEYVTSASGTLTKTGDNVRTSSGNYPANDVLTAVAVNVIQDIAYNTAAAGNAASNIRSVADGLNISGAVGGSGQLKVTLLYADSTTTAEVNTQVNDGTIAVTKAVYDVKPCITVETQADDGTVACQEGTQITNDQLAGATVTFRLPVPTAMTGDLVKVSHTADGETGPDWTKICKVQGSGSARYAELSASSFSTYTMEAIPTGTAALNADTGSTYTDLAEALSGAASGQTVLLTADIDTNTAAYSIPDGVTLDLNGRNVTAYGVTAAGSGLIIDTGSTPGSLTVTADCFAYPNPNASYLPVCVSADESNAVYKFAVKPEFNGVWVGSSFYFRLDPSTDASVLSLLKSAAEAASPTAEIGFTLTYNDVNNNPKTVSFKAGSAVFAEYLRQIISNENANACLVAAFADNGGFTLTSAHVYVKSTAAGCTVTGTEVVK